VGGGYELAICRIERVEWGGVGCWLMESEILSLLEICGCMGDMEMVWRRSLHRLSMIA
jgi:hypothetical protein